jgi:hypothetical protein
LNPVTGNALAFGELGTNAIGLWPMKVVGVSRRTLFEQIDRPALKPLPGTPFETRRTD